MGHLKMFSCLSLHQETLNTGLWFIHYLIHPIISQWMEVIGQEHGEKAQNFKKGPFGPPSWA